VIVLPLFNSQTSQEIDRILALLQILSDWVDEIPPLQTPQRFGNLAFRSWGTRLEEASPSGVCDRVSHSDDYILAF
jgi:serine/threonine-protein phosphatase 2A activator